MNIKKIFFALIVTTLLIGSACAANMNNFKVDEFNNSYINDLNSGYVSSTGDSGVSIYKNTGYGYYDYDDGYYDYDDDGYYDYDDDGYYDYDDYYDHDYDDGYYFHNGGVYNGIRDDMQLTKNADNTATYTDYDDAEHGIVEVIQVGGEQYTVVFWAKDASNVDNTALMAKLTDFNKDNGVAPVAF